MQKSFHKTGELYLLINTGLLEMAIECIMCVCVGQSPPNVGKYEQPSLSREIYLFQRWSPKRSWKTNVLCLTNEAAFHKDWIAVSTAKIEHAKLSNISCLI